MAEQAEVQKKGARKTVHAVAFPIYKDGRTGDAIATGDGPTVVEACVYMSTEAQGWVGENDEDEDLVGLDVTITWRDREDD